MIDLSASIRLSRETIAYHMSEVRYWSANAQVLVMHMQIVGNDAEYRKLANRAQHNAAEHYQKMVYERTCLYTYMKMQDLLGCMP